MIIDPMVETLWGTCGVACVFEYRQDYWWDGEPTTQTKKQRAKVLDNTLKVAFEEAGIGHVVAGFIDNEVCKIVYNYIASKCKVVYQSPVKVNKNSGNEFFFIVFTKG